MAPNRPVEALAICRTSSIGAIVPPAVTTTFIAMPLHPGTAAASLRRTDRRSSPDRIRSPPPPSGHRMMATTLPTDPAARELFDEMARWPIFDPHSHIDAHRPAARNLDEVLGYHYYTELAHSAGMPADLVAPGLDPRERARNLADLPRPDRQHGPVFLADGDRPDLPRLPARPDHARERRRPLRPRRPRGRRPGLGPRGLGPDPARGRLPDQRLRRPPRRLGHPPSTSPASGPTTWS